MILSKNYHRALEQVKELIKNKEDLNILDDSGNTYLTKISQYGNIEIVKLLIKNGSDINYKERLNSYATPIENAIYLGHTEIVKILIENNADLNIINRDGLNLKEIVKEKLNSSNDKKQNYEEILTILNSKLPN